MAKNKIIPVILSGGSGTRMWPLSRRDYPKQFLSLASSASPSRTMFQDTIARLYGRGGVSPPVAAPMVICNQEHRFMVAEQIREMDLPAAPTIVLEPAGKNTAPAAAVAALLAEDADDILLILPADHAVADAAALVKAIEAARAVLTAAGDGDDDNAALATFGVTPTAPATGYGYIQRGEAVMQSAAGAAYQARRFVEKPDRAQAERYVADGGYYWNSGMFAFRAGVLLREMEQHRPDILAHCRAAAAGAATDLDFIRLGQAAFRACPADSIDYAVMEKTDRAVVIPLQAGWSDVGSWQSLWEASPRDDDGNRLHGDAMAWRAENCLVHASHRLVAAIGVRDMIIVETPDAVMVAAKDEAQHIKQIVEQLQSAGRKEALAHRKVHRPWGWYDSVDAGPRHQAKRIMVSPGARLSYQQHRRRAEHWIVVKGEAKITLNEREFTLRENESTYIPVGARHRLGNPAATPLEIIEVQTGDYLGEDDIVRLDDDYGRKQEK